MEGASEGVGEEVEEDIIVVLVGRLEEITVPVHTAKVVKCLFCKKKCSISLATLKTIVQKAKKWSPVCMRCAVKKNLKLEFEPFSNEQIQELGDTIDYVKMCKGKGS